MRAATQRQRSSKTLGRMGNPARGRRRSGRPNAKKLHAEWWEARIARQKEIDASIAAKAEFEYLYDKPYADNSRIRVAGPFTVESLSPHRVVAGRRGRRADRHAGASAEAAAPRRRSDFAQMVLENLKTAGVQQAHKEDRITFTALTPLAGQVDLRRRPLHAKATQAGDGARGDLDRPRIRHRLPPGSRRRRARGGRRRLRRADRLRLQFRRPFGRTRPSSAASRS